MSTTVLNRRSNISVRGPSKRHVANTAAILAAFLTLFPQPAAAQTDVATPWNECWILSASAGVASTASETGPLLGAAVSWELTRRFSVEASSSWMKRADAVNAVSAAITARIMLSRRRTVTPFVQGGVGAFVMTIDPSRADVPEFYRDRLPSGSRFHQRTFTDPSAVIGVGVDVRASDRVYIRPVVDLITVLRDRSSMTVVTGRIEFAYYLQIPRITPSSR